MSARWVVVAATLVVALLASCTGSPTQPTTSPTAVASTPTYVCTPPAGGPATPYACDKTTYEKQQAQLALEAEALEVYNRYAKEYWRLIFAGGAEAPTPELDATIADPFRKNIVALLAHQKSSGNLAKGEPATFRAAIDRTTRREDALVVLTTCEDSRGGAMYGPDGSLIGPGQLVVATRAMKRQDGKLRIFSNIDKVQAQCPF